jgi:hypothetical protein
MRPLGWSWAGFFQPEITENFQPGPNPARPEKCSGLVTSTEMPAPITTPAFTTTAMTALTKRPQATTATITNKSSRASLQLTHELGGYIRRMRSRAPTENMKNIIKHQDRPTEPEHDSLTPSQARGLLTRARIRAPFDGEMIFLKHKVIQHH